MGRNSRNTTTSKLTTTSWDKDGAGDHGIYARGALIYDNVSQNIDIIDTLAAKAAVSNKNMCGIMVEGTVRGRHIALRSGGIEREAEVVDKTTATYTHMTADHRWCVHPDNFHITALWLTHDYTTQDKVHTTRRQSTATASTEAVQPQRQHRCCRCSCSGIAVATGRGASGVLAAAGTATGQPGPIASLPFTSIASML